jgi:hypothetical protein
MPTFREPTISLHRYGVRYGAFVCPACRDEPQDDCGDVCGTRWPDYMPPMGCDEFWPACPCCALPAELVAPLIAV